MKDNLLNKSSDLKAQPSENLNDRNTQYNDKLYHVMANQITFVQNELIAENEIMKLLINDRNISNKSKDRDASPKVNTNREKHVLKISNLNETASDVEKKRKHETFADANI